MWAYRRVHGTRDDIEFVRGKLRDQLHNAAPRDKDATLWTTDDLLAHYLVYLEEQGRELRTIRCYAATNWVSPSIGTKSARRTTPDEIDRCFARMPRAGQSSASMHYVKALLPGA